MVYKEIYVQAGITTPRRLVVGGVPIYHNDTIKGVRIVVLKKEDLSKVYDHIIGKPSDAFSIPTLDKLDSQGPFIVTLATFGPTSEWANIELPMPKGSATFASDYSGFVLKAAGSNNEALALIRDTEKNILISKKGNIPRVEYTVGVETEPLPPDNVTISTPEGNTSTKMGLTQVGFVPLLVGAGLVALMAGRERLSD